MLARRLTQEPEGIIHRPRLLVGAHRGKGIEDVGHSGDTALEGNGLASQAVWVAGVERSIVSRIINANSAKYQLLTPPQVSAFFTLTEMPPRIISAPLSNRMILLR